MTDAYYKALRNQAKILFGKKKNQNKPAKKRQRV